jgi:hypothetical protein
MAASKQEWKNRLQYNFINNRFSYKYSHEAHTRKYGAELRAHLILALQFACFVGIRKRNFASSFTVLRLYYAPFKGPEPTNGGTANTRIRGGKWKSKQIKHSSRISVSSWSY